ncbi:ABC transporter substrate-binding protein [Methanofollis formosanus]|nr:ABC transporter substrate-binding protein [Methanofollis formosanus]
MKSLKYIFSCLFLAAMVLVPGASAAGIPGDLDGDTTVSDEELSQAIIPYMEASYLDLDTESLDRESLSLAAHNCIRIPYGKVIIPVSSAGDLMQGNILKKGGAPTGSLMYEGLITRNSYEGVYDCWLAEDWDVSDDATVWTFYLPEDATWHDGVPVTSEDIQFTHDYIKSKKLWISSVLMAVDHVECPDEHTVEYHLKEPYLMFGDKISHCPGICVIPKHIWADVDDPDHWQDNKFIGCGPFIFKNRVSDQSMLLQANCDYHGNVPYVNNVVLTVIPDMGSRILAFKSGEVDVVGDLDAATATDLAGEEDINVYSIPDTRGIELSYNTLTYPANITGFRQAMCHAVDRDTIINLVFGGYATPTTTTFLMPGVAHDYVNPEIPPYDYDIDKAAAMLKEAGFDDIDDDGILEGPDGNDLSLTFLIWSSGNEARIAEVLKNDWKNLGIDLEIKQIDSSQWQKEVHNYPMFFSGMPYLMHDDPEDMTHFGSNEFFGKPNWYDYSNPEFDRLISDLRSTADDSERKEIGYQMQEIFAKDVPCVPICSIDSIVAYRSDRFTGWESVNPMYWNVVDIKQLSNIKPVSPVKKEK